MKDEFETIQSLQDFQHALKQTNDPVVAALIVIADQLINLNDNVMSINASIAHIDYQIQHMDYKNSAE